ncbi:MAG: hypothetical protein BGO67_02740 [Alphaproteobacteria bacterium 41-28]|nr:MAG: hypothetical protein BGO67_02740 [Alphaproteobacteria bacterium 41-28]
MQKTDILNLYLTPEMEDYFQRNLLGQPVEQIRIKLKELLKFLLLLPYSKGIIAISNEIDDLWHLWILQTRQYKKLMDKLPTKKFIHHSATEYIEKCEKILALDKKKEVNRQISFLVSYINNFGPFTESTVKYWPMALQIFDQLGNDINKLNIFLSTLYQND